MSPHSSTRPAATDGKAPRSGEATATGVAPGRASCPTCGAALAPASGPERRCLVCLLRCAIDEPPTRIGSYEILGEIGRGGMGVVYLARNAFSNKTVALKTIQPGFAAGGFTAGDATLHLFRREMEAAVAVEHPGIAPILHVGEEADPLYFTMPVYPASLADRLEDYRTPRDAAALVRRLAHAVQHAHGRGVLHLDIKPANVLIDESGAPHVADFGLARWLGERQAAEGASTASEGGRPYASVARVSGSRPMGGTPRYMAPEQLAGGRAVTEAADVYALGLILYEALTGRPALGDDAEGEGPRPTTRPPRELERGLPRDLEAICLRCLDPEPLHRYGSAGDLAADLGRFLRREPVHARPPSLFGRGWRLALRRPLAVLVTLGVCTLLATVVSDLLRIVATQRDQLSQSVLRANEWSAEVASNAVTYLLRERMAWVEQMAREPRMAELAAGPPVDDAPDLARYRRDGFDIVVVLDRHGVLNAIWPRGKRDIVGRDYSWRDYFRSTCDPDATDVKPGAYVARSFVSENDDDYNLSISAPIVRSGRCEGVVLTTLLTDSALGPFQMIPRGDPRHKGVLIGPEDRGRDSKPSAYPEPYLVLLHDRLRAAQGVHLPLDLSRRLHAAFGGPRRRVETPEPAAAEPLLDDAYVDPLGDPDERWLVSFRPVGETGLIVGVQTRDDLVEAPSVTLLRGLARVAAVVVAAGLVLSAGAALLRARLLEP